MQLFVLLLLFLLSHAMVTAVPGCLSDRDKDHRPRKNCTAAGFSTVPEGIEPSTKVLLFPRNLFSSLSWHSFLIFTEIYEIDFTGNKVPEVPPSATPILPTLSVLRLGSNHLTSLSDGSFSACPALIELYLEKNSIDSLSDHTFSGLSKLEILDLSSNRIKVLPKLMLHPLPAIETLYLEDNKINVMPDDWFSKKKEVPYLYLSANPWACSCSLGYLRRYLDDYEFNIYVRDGPLIKSDGESVVCDSPQTLKGSPVLSLEESDLCSVPEPEESVVWYRRVYKPLSVALAKRGGGSDGVRLLTYSRREEKEVAGEEGVMALYRSVLFIHKEREEAMEREDGGKEDDEGGEGGKERLLVTLKPTGSEEVKREDGGERGGREERGVYRKTLYRLLSKEEEIEGWRDVMEECRVSAEDGGRTGRGKDGGMERERSGGGGVVSRKRYSVILREEMGEAGGAREERDWVVGGWEVKRGEGEEGEGGEQPRSSWGEWLAHYLPSMPWGVTMPPEGEAAE
ncbi:platelet glycoprotein Ib alpha chain [Lates japonicus]|uniref:Platelet glycoprotein Ib alpha chain n=1 Tax=Lates japonicus TaxID=270547 RepID=A0AAD3NF28_LATJO|nr:platelet glycoprotein Ib alpha chain [Lates japonicus]